MKFKIPQDKGWAWMSVIGAHWCMFCVVASFKSQGILFVEFVDAFEASNALTSWMMGVTACGMSLCSPVATYLATRYSSRVVVATGSLLCSAAALLTSFAPNIYFVIGIYGGVTGIGYACLFAPSLMMIGIYFEKRRSLANGLALAGASVGQLVIPVLMTALIKYYTVWGALLIFSAVLLHGLVAAMLMRPPHFYTRRSGSMCCGKKAAFDIVQQRTENTQQQTSNSEPVPGEIQSCDSKSTSKESDCLESNSKTGDTYNADLCFKLTEKIEPSQQTNASSEKVIHRNRFRYFMHRVSKFYNWKHLKNTLYLIYLGACVFGNSAYVDHSLLIPPYAASIDISKDTVAYLLATIGISDLMGRILGGCFADLKLVARWLQMSVAMMVIGVVTMVCTCVPGLASLGVMCVVLGFVGGLYVSMYTMVLIDFLGLPAFPSAFGLMVMFQGLFNTGLPVLLGWLSDVTGAYQASLWVAGALMVLSGSFLLLKPLAARHEAHKTHSPT